MGRIVGIISLKGGVGKTTIASSLAADLARAHNKRVLLVDANFSAPNVSSHMRVLSPESYVGDYLSGVAAEHAIHTRFGVDVMPGTFLSRKSVHTDRLRAKLVALKEKYDFIIVDSAPSLNDEFFSAFFAADDLLMVTTPDYPTLSTSMKLAKIARHRGKQIRGVIVNRMTGSPRELTLHEIQESTGLPVVSTLREHKDVRDSLHYQAPITALFPNHAFSRELRKLSISLLGVKERIPAWKRFIFSDMAAQEVNREVLRQRFYTSIFVEDHEIKS